MLNESSTQGNNMSESQLTVFLPGTMCTHTMFSHQLEHIDNSILVQFTEEKTIDAMVDTVVKTTGNAVINLIGFSMGGIVALRFAQLYPERINKLVLMSSNSHEDIAGRVETRQLQISQAEQNGLIAVMSESFLPNYLYQPNQVSELLILQMAESLGIECFKAQLAALSTRGDTLSVLQTIQKPVLILAGAADKLCAPAHQRVMHDSCPSSDLIMLGQCGHFPMLERQALTTQILKEWL